MAKTPTSAPSTQKMKVVLYDGVKFNSFAVGKKTAETTTTLDADYATLFRRSWDTDDVINLDFSTNGSAFSASNYGDTIGNVDEFLVYKTMGNTDTLYPVGEIEAKTDADGNKTIGMVVEDYIIGDKVDYTYYIYPVVKDDSGNKYVHTALTTTSKSFSSGALKILGLIQDTDNLDKYYIDQDNIWVLGLNVKDDGLTINMDKTFTDTQNKMPRETAGQKNYVTKSISGLLGKIDCSTQQYTDTFDDIESFRAFCASPNLKIVIDTRGIVIPCDIDTGKIEYSTEVTGAANANITIKQLMDYKDIKINGLSWTKSPITYGVYDATSNADGAKIFSGVMT